MEKISKSFGGIQALLNVDLCLHSGEVLGLVGENGAGKSTLMKILSGIVQADRGKIFLDGGETAIASPSDAQKMGIAMIPQELLLVPELSVAQNLFLGHELCNNGGLLNKKRMREKTEEILSSLDSAYIRADALVGELPKADQQIVAIARRLLQKGRIFIMDEPTAALTGKETETLFGIIRRISASGCSTIYISHRLEEDLEICDRFTVLRDGEVAQDFPNAPEVDTQTLVYHMVGSRIGDEFPHTAARRGNEVLRVNRLAFRTYQGALVKDVDFSLHKGEVVSITGLVGVGKTELGQTLMGLRKRIGGSLSLDGAQTVIQSPMDAVRHGIGYVSEDRRDEGLVLALESKYNMTLSCLRKISTASVLSSSREKRLVSKFMDRLSMKAQYLEMEAQQLSGGNQQKIVILRQIISDARIILLDEPTKGIDVGAKSEVSRIIGELSQEGKAILILSSEPREVLGISDVIYVLTTRGMQGPFMRGNLTYSQLMAIELGQTRGE